MLSACNSKTNNEETNSNAVSSPATETTEESAANSGTGTIGTSTVTNHEDTASSADSSSHVQSTVEGTAVEDNVNNGSANHTNVNDNSGASTGTSTNSNNTNNTSVGSNSEDTTDSTGTSNDNNTTSNDDNTTGNDQNHTGGQDDNGTTGGGNDQNTTGGQDGNSNTGNDANISTRTLKTLTLTSAKITLNKDDNTTVKVEATYSDGSTKEINDDVVWVVTPSHAVQVNNNTLIAKKDGNVTVQAMVNGVKSNSISLNITWVVDGHVLPPEPDPAVNNATLLGVDVNDNGVRDDVERWIYEEYKDKHPVYIDIAMQAARGYKLVLETPERAKEMEKELSAPVYCEGYFSSFADQFGDTIYIHQRILDDIFDKKYFNTVERNQQYKIYQNTLSGDSYTVPWPSEGKNYCDFNTSKYEE